MSFIAARSLQKAGVENYYVKKATNFQKEDGYFDLQHPNSVRTLPMGVQPFSDVTLLDSTHLIGLDQESGSLFVYDFDKLIVVRGVIFQIAISHWTGT